MEKDLLSEVVIVEKEIQRCIEEEQQKAKARLEEMKRRAGEDVAREEKNIRESLDREMNDARRDAERRAEELVQEAAGQVTRLGDLDDRTLTGIILKRIPQILLG